MHCIYSHSGNPCDPAPSAQFQNGVVDVSENFTDANISIVCDPGYTLVQNTSHPTSTNKLICGLSREWLYSASCEGEHDIAESL